MNPKPNLLDEIKSKFSPKAWYRMRVAGILFFVWQTIEFLLLVVQGGSNFFCTVFTYIYLLIFTILLCRWLKLSENKRLMFISTIAVLFVCEVWLRFGLKHPLTYSELNGGKYFSAYNYESVNQLFFRPSAQQPNLHLHRAKPFEMRNPADAEDRIMPLEKFNALGFRGKLPVKKKKVVLCLGDSFTESVCVTVDSSYPVMLEQQLQTLDPDIEVMNAGIGGSDPFFNFKNLQFLADSFGVNTAVFLVNTTDINDFITGGGMERFSADGKLHLRATPWWERIYAVSLIVRLFVHNVLKLDFNFHTASEKLLLEQQAIKALHQLFEKHVVPFCQSRNIRVVVAMHPLKGELQDPALYNNLFAEIASVQGLQMANTYNAIKQRNSQHSIIYPMDLHFNGEGYQIIAQSVFDVFKNTNN